MWKSLIDKFSGKDRKRGYTLAELLAVIAIIAVVSAIAITGIVTISRTLKFKQRNDYAKTVFLAAQANLSEMRSDGSLFKLHSDCDSEAVPEGHCGFPATDWSYEYVFTCSEFPEPEGSIRRSYDIVLPVNSVESVVRDRNIIIEYNPLTGNVYAVFYCDDEILSQYRDGTLPRDEADRKKLMLGYYDGSGLSSSKLDLESTEAYMVFDKDGEEGILTVKVPVSESYYAHLNEFMNGLSIELTMNGEFYGGSIGPFMVDVSKGKIDVDGKTVMFDFVMDSLADLGSFANMAAKPTVDVNGNETDNTGKHLSAYLDESEFAILPGDNVKVKAKVDFNCEDGGIEVDVDDAFLVFNPMFDELMESSVDDGFTLSVSNGRHLQNLNALAPTVANRVSLVVFDDDIYWNETVAYYNNKYNAGNTYENAPAENPARGLPYFVPIHNENLFGTATFEYPDENNRNGLWALIGDLVEKYFGSGGSITNFFKGDIRVPMLTDALDANIPTGSTKSIAQSHAKIMGENHRVYYLDIDSTRYAIPNKGETVKTKVDNQEITLHLDGTYYATGTRQIVDYQFTGLFGYVNTYVENLHVVNPIVKGNTFVDEKKKQVPVWSFEWKGLLPQYTITGYVEQDVESNPATGALVGASGYNSQIVGCSTFIDTEDEYFSRAYMGHSDYDAGAAQNWYGVSGKGAVGGLIGYAKSHRTTKENLDNDLIHLAFRDCFAAVNVSGDMRGNEKKHYGYSNGVGGLIGNSQLTNFYNCYASGNVRANGMYVSSTDLDNITETARKWLEALFGITLELPYNGRTSIGAGGFVGTSHGTRYTKCFATGTVTGSTIKGGGSAECGAGGFVGIMSLDENFSYGSNLDDTSIAQTTILTECYAVGETFCNKVSSENFSGANARINFNISQANAYMTSDYYRLYAPHYNEHYSEGEGKRDPSYDDTYVFRDSYYLSGYHNAVQENSNNCATAETYATFRDLVATHKSDSTWKDAKIKEIKSIERLKIGWIEITYGNTYFQSHSELNDIYRTLYSKGYQSGWGPATEETTHSYSMNAAGARYPFTKLENLDYYGDWPGSPSSVGLAYYETYLDENGKETGRYYYFDRDNTSELSKSANTVVRSDGYAVLTASAGTVKVKIGDKTYNLRGKSDGSGGYDPDDTFRPGNGTYEVYLLTEEIMDAAMAESVKTGEFYVQVTITDPKDETYITYFNPAIALTQVNPIADPSDKTEYRPNEIPEDQVAAKPTTIPPQLNIRSARQLAALSQNKILWGENYHYVQQFDIDASTYKWSDAEDKKIGCIGNDTDVFKGTYQGGGGYVTQAKITGFEPTKGFFGSVANTGKISNLDITVGKLTVGGKNDTNAGILAGTNGGLISNINLTIEGDVTLTAKNSAGLLVGRNFASSNGDDNLYPANITNCYVSAQNVTINAGNAGGLVGEAVGENRLNLSSFTDNTVHMLELTSNGGMVGGMVGSAELVNFTRSGVETVIKAENALYAGGFAGGVYDGNVTTLVVNLSGDCVAQDTLGGLAGTASGTVFAAANVDMSQGRSLTADVAAGAFGVADGINLKNGTGSINLKNTAINGTTGAAGFAYQILGDSYIQTASVTLTSGSVTASGADGKAAGYAVVNEGAISTCAVKLGTNKENAVAITGGVEAVGFAGTVSGSISDCSTSGYGSITATADDGRAAGFAGDVTGSIGLSYVSPAYNDHKDYYNGNSNANLPVTAKTVAGFALSVGEEGMISGSYTLCKLNGSAYGFAVSNAGTISESTSNVTQTGGISFVGDHSGLINNCYGWYGNDEVTNMVSCVGEDSTGKITSSYFVNVDNREGKADLYDVSGKHSEVFPEQISPDDLNVENADLWVQDNNYYKTFAYDTDLRPGFYPYPRLRDHHGDWVREIQYAYGVVYYEEYKYDEDYKGEKVELAYTIKDLSDPYETVEGELNEFKPLDVNSVDLQGNEAQITETGYILFYNENKCPFSESLLGDPLNETDPICQAMGGRYICVKLKTDENNPIVTVQAQVQLPSSDANEKPLSTSILVVPAFADAIVSKDNRIYKVRTPEQLSHVGEEAYRGAKFVQNHDIVVDQIENIDRFNKNNQTNPFIGTYTTENESELRIKSAPNGWMTNVYAGSGGVGSGSVSLYNMILEDVNETTPIFGTVGGTVSGNITAEGDDGIDGKLIGTVETTGVVSDMTVTASAASASLVGELKGTVSGVTMEISKVEVNSKDKNETDVDVFGIVANTASKDAVMTNTTVKTDKIVINDLTATFGGLIGSNAGTITGSSVQGSKDETPAEITLGDADSDANRTLTVGGLVGENTGTIKAVTKKKSQTVSSANVEILYNQVEPKKDENGTVVAQPQPEVETIVIGGLVGSNAGIVNNASVTGAISTNADMDGKNFIIGGAVGYESAAGTYNDVAAAVTVDANWAGAVNVESENTFNGLLTNNGPVGMFVGFAHSGTYTNCTSTADNKIYQFVGEASQSKGNYDGTAWESERTDEKLYSYSDWLENDNTYPIVDGGTLNKKTGEFTYVAALLDGCTFNLDGVQMLQTYGDAVHYYGISDFENHKSYGSRPVTGGFDTSPDPAFKNISSSTSYTATNFFIKVDDTYCKMYIKRKSELWGSTYYIKWATNNSGSFSSEYDFWITGDGTIEERFRRKSMTVEVCSATAPTGLDPSLEYLVTTGNNAYAAKNSEEIITVPLATSFYQRDDMYYARWKFSKSGNTDTWTTVVTGAAYSRSTASMGVDTSRDYYDANNMPIGTYPIDGTNCPIYSVYVTSNEAYRKLTFTQQGDMDYTRQYLAMETVETEE